MTPKSKKIRILGEKVTQSLRWLGRFSAFGSVTYHGMLLRSKAKNRSNPATPGPLQFYEMGSKYMQNKNKTDNQSSTGPQFDADDLKEAVRVMKEGGIILYPTDTVWGIGCDASNPQAIEKIFRLKKRSDSKSMLALVGSEGMLQRTVKNVPDIAWQLIDVAVNPITIIYDEPTGVAENLKAEDGSLGVRITDEKFSKALCERMHGPIVSTSANISGKPTPMTFSEISSEIKEGVDYVCRYRRTDKSKAAPSNIIKVTQGNVIKVIR